MSVLLIEFQNKWYYNVNAVFDSFLLHMLFSAKTAHFMQDFLCIVFYL